MRLVFWTYNLWEEKMKKNGLLFIMLVFAFNVNCMQRNLYWDIQNTVSRTVYAVVNSGSARFVDRLYKKVSEISTEKSLRISVPDESKKTNVTLFADKKYTHPLVSIIINNVHADSPIDAYLSKKYGDIDAVLYLSRSGGGNSFVLSIGKSKEEVSVDSVREHQKFGKVQQFIPISVK
jgi:hypothetical protein